MSHYVLPTLPKTTLDIVPYTMPLTSQHILYKDNVTNLLARAKYKIHICVDDVYASTSYDPKTVQIIKESYPLYKLLTDDITPNILGRWEIFHKTIYATLTSSLKSQHAILLRTLFIGNDDSSMLTKIVSKFSSTHRRHINYITLHMATIDSIDYGQNEVAAKLKLADAIIIQNVTSPYKYILFAIYTVHIGGSILAEIPVVRDSSSVTIIALACSCFDRVEMHHITAEDKLYIYCSNFTGIVQEPIKLKKMWHRIDTLINTSILNESFLQSKIFINFANKLLDINYDIHNWRYTHFYKLVMCYLQLRSHASDAFANFDKTIVTNMFKDISKKWASANEFALYDRD